MLGGLVDVEVLDPTSCDQPEVLGAWKVGKKREIRYG